MKTLRNIFNYCFIFTTLLLLLFTFILTNNRNIDQVLSSTSSSLLPISSNDSTSHHLVQWKINQNGVVSHHGQTIIYNNRNYTLNINNEQKCNTIREDTISILIIILSNVINFDRRQVIRDTWGLDLMQQLANYRILYLVGLTNNTDVQERLRFENLIYNDIIQINIEDTFYNLTYKSIHMLHWYINFCRQAKYLFKTDDDIYLHLPNLIKYLIKYSNNNNNNNNQSSLICRRNRSRKIIRNTNLKEILIYSSSSSSLSSYYYQNDEQLIERSRKKFRKYIVDDQLLPGKYYPDYCSGFGYLMDYNVAIRLFNVSNTIPYIGIEDVFITGFCRDKANITILNNLNFQLNPPIHSIESRCIFETDRITSNEMNNIIDMKTLWTHVNTQGYYCKYNNNNNSKQYHH